jgi:hypothetical protein
MITWRDAAWFFVGMAAGLFAWFVNRRATTTTSEMELGLMRRELAMVRRVEVIQKEIIERAQEYIAALEEERAALGALEEERAALHAALGAKDPR